MKTLKTELYTVLIILGFFLLFRYAAEDGLFRRSAQTELPQANKIADGLVAGRVLQYEFEATLEWLEGVSIYLATYARTNTDTLRIEILDSQGIVLGRIEEGTEQLLDNSVHRFSFPEKLKLKEGQRYRIQVQSLNGTPDNCITIYMDGDTMCLSLEGIRTTFVSKVYWNFVFVVEVLVVLLFLFRDWWEKKKGRTFVSIKTTIGKYRYLMKQLVVRDFKVKYKRSVLGMCWSFLNPMLTMLVQYVVFSTLFRSDIEYYSVYLLTGIILFNFFSEAVGVGLSSIVGNAALITKVQVPKCIYPISRVLSTSINFFISLLPLGIVSLLTGIHFRRSLFLTFFVVVTLLTFTLGVTFLLATAMTFFRDTQFLWSVVSMMWMYATPIFYPETIVPVQFQWIQTWNPLYHIIKFARTILISGCSPDGRSYASCLLSSCLSCLVGYLVFQRAENKFVLYI